MWEWLILIIIICVIIFLIYYWVTVYNGFLYYQQLINEKLSNIEVLMQKRIDLIMTIIKVAKTYNLHENSTFKETAGARNKWKPDASVNERVTAMSDMDENFLKVNAVVEQYPALKADLLNNNVLQNDVEVEKELMDERFKYNKLVKEYNYEISFFPQSIIARFYNFSLCKFLQFDEKSKIYEQIKI